MYEYGLYPLEIPVYMEVGGGWTFGRYSSDVTFSPIFKPLQKVYLTHNFPVFLIVEIKTFVLLGSIQIYTNFSLFLYFICKFDTHY